MNSPHVAGLCFFFLTVSSGVLAGCSDASTSTPLNVPPAQVDGGTSTLEDAAPDAEEPPPSDGGAAADAEPVVPPSAFDLVIDGSPVTVGSLKVNSYKDSFSLDAELSGNEEFEIVFDRGATQDIGRWASYRRRLIGGDDVFDTQSRGGVWSAKLTHSSNTGYSAGTASGTLSSGGTSPRKHIFSLRWAQPVPSKP